MTQRCPHIRQPDIQLCRRSNPWNPCLPLSVLSHAEKFGRYMPTPIAYLTICTFLNLWTQLTPRLHHLWATQKMISLWVADLADLQQSKPPMMQATNHLLAQRALTIKEKTAAFAFNRDTWENNKAFVPVKHYDLPPNTNVNRSHNMFKKKDCDCVKARIVPRGHCNTTKHKLRTDFSCLNLKIFCLIMSIAAEQRRQIA